MSKSKIQPLTASILSRSKINLLLLQSHGIPLARLAGVAPHVEELDGDDQQHVVRNEAEQDLVAGAVVRRVWRLVDVGCDHRRRLHGHVVDGRADRACAYRAGVARG
jgi:hypothetical protein